MTIEEKVDRNNLILIRYINSLLKKPKIRNKDYLRVIKDDIKTIGYVEKGYKEKFILSFLTADRTITPNIGAILIDIRTYSLEEPLQQTNLENFFK